MHTILVVDDEPQIAAIARDYLEHAGFKVITAARGDAVTGIVRSRQPDLIVLDLALPGTDGIDVAKALRRESDLPIVMLTARVEESDRLRGLDVGADDYITKPFSPRELVARVKAVLRRARGAAVAGDVVHYSDLVLDGAALTATRGGECIDLTATEFRILSTLGRRPGRVFTRAQLLDAIRGEAVETYERAIDTHIKNIRRKIEPDVRRPRYIQSVYGVGYRAVEP